MSVGECTCLHTVHGLAGGRDMDPSETGGYPPGMSEESMDLRFCR